MKRFDANTYLYVAGAYFDLARRRGDGRQTKALRDVRNAPAHRVQLGRLYPRRFAELAAAARSAGRDVELHVIDAPYGHDCFLEEEARQTL